MVVYSSGKQRQSCEKGKGGKERRGEERRGAGGEEWSRRLPLG